MLKDRCLVGRDAGTTASGFDPYGLTIVLIPGFDPYGPTTTGVSSSWVGRLPAAVPDIVKTLPIQLR